MAPAPEMSHAYRNIKLGDAGNTEVTSSINEYQFKEEKKYTYKRQKQPWTCGICPGDEPCLQEHKTGRRWQRVGNVLHFSKPGLKKQSKNNEHQFIEKVKLYIRNMQKQLDTTTLSQIFP